jgi:tetratricopeptide (TPR) repeat protein
MVDELITALSRFRSFVVVPRNSSFAYRGRGDDIREVARTLGARYLLTGSVRRGGNRLRLTVQLVDGTDNVTLWAQTFEGALDEVFEFQDRITAKAASSIEPHVQQAELSRSRLERPDSLAAYDLYLRAVAEIYLFTPGGSEAALHLLEQAIALEPNNGVFLAFAAWSLELRATMGWQPIGPDDRQRCLDYAHRAVEQAPNDARVLAHAGVAMQLVGGEYERGLRVAIRAAELNPNDSVAVLSAGVAEFLGGDLDEARRHLLRAIDIQPTNAGDAMGTLSNVCAAQGRHEEALGWAGRAIAVDPNYQPSHWVMVASNAILGRMDEAHEALRVLLELVPDLTLERLSLVGTKDRKGRDGVLVNGMLLAGLRER